MRTFAVSLTPQQAQMMQNTAAGLKSAYAEGMVSGEGREVGAATLLSELKAEKDKRKEVF